MKKKALVVALAEYKNSKNNLKGVHRDVPSIMSVLSRFGIHDVQVVRDKMATADGIRTALNQLVLGLEEGDHAVFYYSGHGFRLQPSLSTGSGETDGRDEALVPWEGDLGSLIRDDWMEAFLRTKLHAKANFWGVYDACHSGTMYKALELDGVPNSYSQSKELQIENLEFTTFPSGFGKMVSGVKSLVLDDSALHAVHLAERKRNKRRFVWRSKVRREAYLPTLSKSPRFREYQSKTSATESPKSCQT